MVAGQDLSQQDSGESVDGERVGGESAVESLHDANLQMPTDLARPSVGAARSSAREFIEKMRAFSQLGNPSTDDDKTLASYLGLTQDQFEGLISGSESDPEEKVVELMLAPVRKYQEHLRRFESLLLEDPEPTELKQISQDTMDDIIEIGRELEKFSVAFQRVLGILIITSDPIRMLSVNRQSLSKVFSDERKNFLQHGEEAVRRSLRLLNATRGMMDEAVMPPQS